MNEQEQTIDLRILLKVLLKHIIPIIILAVVGAGIGYSVAKFIVPKRYTSTALMYVENTSGKKDETTINSADLTAAQKLVSTCQILFTSNYVLGELNAAIDGKYSITRLNNMIKISSVNNTEVLSITVTAGSAEDAYDIASKLVAFSTDEFHRIIKGGSIETVSEPTRPKSHTYPSSFRFAAIGGLIGLFGTYFIFFIVELLDNKVKPDDDLSLMYQIPVFAEILDFEAASKGGKYGYSKYGYSSYSSYDADIQEEEKLYSDDEDEDEDENGEEEEDKRSLKKPERGN